MVKIAKRRRYENKTDYKSRFAFLKSGKLRLVVRKTNRYIIAQIIESDISQDKVLFGANSKELLSKGLSKDNSGSLKSLPAAYLTGFMLAKNAKGKIKEVILDIGLNRNIHKSRIYAVVKGAIDGGLNIPHNKDVLPSMEDISAKPLGKLLDKIKQSI